MVNLHTFTGVALLVSRLCERTIAFIHGFTLTPIHWCWGFTALAFCKGVGVNDPEGEPEGLNGKYNLRSKVSLPFLMP